MLSDPSSSVKGDFMQLITHNDIDMVVVGATSYTATSDPDNILGVAWAALANKISSPLPAFLFDNAPCECILVNRDGSINSRDALES